MIKKLKILSLFANTGVAESLLHETNAEVLIAYEIDDRRCKFYQSIYPKTKVICGDIRNKEIFSAIVKTYWEKRDYKAELGAKRDFKAYTCGVFIRMNSRSLANAVDEAANYVAGKTADPEAKAAVRKALQDASTNFEKAKRGEI